MSEKKANNKEMTIEKMEKYKEQRKCLSCKKRCFGDMVTCTICREYSYCSSKCLKQDAELHKRLCQLVGLKKGILEIVPDEIVQQAKFLDDDGYFKPWQSSGEENDSQSRVAPSQVEGSPGQEEITRNTQGDSEMALLANGHFGLCSSATNEKNISGESFGDGWWKTKKSQAPKEDIIAKEAKEGQNDQVAEESKNDEMGKEDKKGEEDKMDKEEKKGKEDQIGHENEIGNEDTENNVTKEEKEDEKGKDDDSSLGKTLEGATGGQELVPYIPGRNREDDDEGPMKLEKCLYCHKESYTMLKCSRCKIGRYCNKECQKKDFPKHKKGCAIRGRFLAALGKIPRLMMVQFMLGGPRLCLKLEDMPNEFHYMLLRVGVAMLLEIVGPYYHPFRHGAKVRDIDGIETHILFYDPMNIYYQEHILFPIPVPLARCLQPGNFILLLNTHWHYFLDGTLGIRVDDLDTVHFIFD